MRFSTEECVEVAKNVGYDIGYADAQKEIIERLNQKLGEIILTLPPIVTQADADKTLGKLAVVKLLQNFMGELVSKISYRTEVAHGASQAAS